ncbi:MAG: extracellular solute-binding protein, partial [Clostridia bacterium]|nr:extracellular solute-binding protein [Clostridia bacterium]
MKRSITAFLLAALAVICLCSCENTSIKENTSAAAPVSADPYEEVSGILPEPAEVSETSEGAKASYTCTVITNDRTVYFSDETAPTAFDRSISERGDFLLERYNISVVVEERNYSEVSKGIKNALDSGLSYCDLLSLPQSDTVKLYLAGLLYDMNTLPSFDPQSEIFDSNHALQLATNSTFYMIPDESAMVYDDLNVVFFNRETVSSAGYDPEALVQSGEWTWDKFSEIAKSVSDVSAGKYGFACYYDGEEFTYPMWMSIGRHVVKDTYKNKVKMTMSADTMLDLTDRLLKHYDTKYIYPKVGDDAAKAFETGNSAFIFHKLRYLYGLRDGSDRGSEYGFLPIVIEQSDGWAYCALGDAEDSPKGWVNADYIVIDP